MAVLSKIVDQGSGFRSHALGFVVGRLSREMPGGHFLLTTCWLTEFAEEPLIGDTVSQSSGLREGVEFRVKASMKVAPKRALEKPRWRPPENPW